MVDSDYVYESAHHFFKENYAPARDNNVQWAGDYCEINLDSGSGIFVRTLESSWRGLLRNNNVLTVHYPAYYVDTYQKYQ